MITTANLLSRPTDLSLRKLCASLTVCAGLSACGGASLESLSDPDAGNNAGISGFEQELKVVAGAGAVFCGNVDLQQSSDITDQCVSDSFSTGAAFYAVYNRAGIDPTVADGVTMDAGGVLHLWSYDSSITGQGDDGPASTTKTRCDLPQYSGSSGQSVADSFQCFVSLDQFQAQIQNDTAAGALFCGKVEAMQLTANVDQCVSDAFSGGRAFYAVYVLQGIDSTVAEGVSGSSSGDIVLWSYDSSVTGQGDSGPSDVRNAVCDSPVYVGGTGQSVSSKFQCGTTTAVFDSHDSLVQYFDGTSYKSLNPGVA